MRHILIAAILFTLFACEQDVQKHIDYEEIIYEHPIDKSAYLEWPADSALLPEKKCFGDAIQFCFSSISEANFNGFVGPRTDEVEAAQLVQFNIDTREEDQFWSIHNNKLLPGRMYQSCYKGQFILKQSLFFIDSVSWVHKYVIDNISDKNESFTPRWTIDLPTGFEMDTLVKKQSRFTNGQVDFWIHLSGSNPLIGSEDRMIYSKVESEHSLMPGEEKKFYAYVQFKTTPDEERLRRKITPWMIFPEEESQKNAREWVEKLELKR